MVHLWYIFIITYEVIQKAWFFVKFIAAGAEKLPVSIDGTANRQYNKNTP